MNAQQNVNIISANTLSSSCTIGKAFIQIGIDKHNKPPGCFGEKVIFVIERGLSMMFCVYLVVVAYWND